MSVRRRNRQLIIDKQTGIVKGRRGAHPQAWLFDAVPMLAGDYPEANLPPISMPEEAKQCFAVHAFDNLNVQTVEQVRERLDAALAAAGIEDGKRTELVAAHSPDDPAYKLVKNTAHGAQPMGLAGAMWVPKDTPEEEFAPPTEPDLPVSDDDLDGMTAEQEAALQRRLDERALHRARLADLDRQTAATAAESEYRKVIGTQMDSLEQRLRGDMQ